MIRPKQVSSIACIISLIVLLFGLPCVAGALEIELQPADAQREIGGKVRVHIYATDADSLISMGVKVTFDPTILQVEDASKYEDFDEGWVMDGDADPGTTDDQYTLPEVVIDNVAGTVTMIGGRLMGTVTMGLTGKVLLGWIKFVAVANGNSFLDIDLAKYNPTPGETFDNFVKLSSIVDEPTNVPGDLGSICIVENACIADVDGDGDVDMMDALKFRNASPSSFGSTNYNPAADLDGDGDVDMMDALKFKQGSPRSVCPSCE